eukprot:Cvel_12184.t2-p1 / transcript=Cvel_12184.t2 / gene=Cvel_12184 / organism=Chromera_velia_CCMP2878 / gene_product=hypothetical protein / transcript_product=hypothetical protein / location=Cvel_scaffold787:18018-22483(+) / protein_length=1162 / sequence_SO=supercontig / SO=protein_coding / is_pseudo=false
MVVVSPGSGGVPCAEEEKEEQKRGIAALEAELDQKAKEVAELQKKLKGEREKEKERDGRVYMTVGAHAHGLAFPFPFPFPSKSATAGCRRKLVGGGGESQQAAASRSSSSNPCRISSTPHSNDASAVTVRRVNFPSEEKGSPARHVGEKGEGRQYNQREGQKESLHSRSAGHSPAASRGDASLSSCHQQPNQQQQQPDARTCEKKQKQRQQLNDALEETLWLAIHMHRDFLSDRTVRFVVLEGSSGAHSKAKGGGKGEVQGRNSQGGGEEREPDGTAVSERSKGREGDGDHYGREVEEGQVEEEREDLEEILSQLPSRPLQELLRDCRTTGTRRLAQELPHIFDRLLSRSLLCVGKEKEKERGAAMQRGERRSENREEKDPADGSREGVGGSKRGAACTVASTDSKEEWGGEDENGLSLLADDLGRAVSVRNSLLRLASKWTSRKRHITRLHASLQAPRGDRPATATAAVSGGGLQKKRGGGERREATHLSNEREEEKGEAEKRTGTSEEAKGAVLRKKQQNGKSAGSRTAARPANRSSEGQLGASLAHKKRPDDHHAASNNNKIAAGSSSLPFPNATAHAPSSSSSAPGPPFHSSANKSKPQQPVKVKVNLHSQTVGIDQLFASSPAFKGERVRVFGSDAAGMGGGGDEGRGNKLELLMESPLLAEPPSNGPMPRPTHSQTPPLPPHSAASFPIHDSGGGHSMRIRRGDNLMKKKQKNAEMERCNPRDINLHPSLHYFAPNPQDRHSYSEQEGHQEDLHSSSSSSSSIRPPTHPPGAAVRPLTTPSSSSPCQAVPVALHLSSETQESAPISFSVPFLPNYPLQEEAEGEGETILIQQHSSGGDPVRVLPGRLIPIGPAAAARVSSGRPTGTPSAPTAPPLPQSHLLRSSSSACCFPVSLSSSSSSSASASASASAADRLHDLSGCRRLSRGTVAPHARTYMINPPSASGCPFPFPNALCVDRGQETGDEIISPPPMHKFDDFQTDTAIADVAYPDYSSQEAGGMSRKGGVTQRGRGPERLKNSKSSCLLIEGDRESKGEHESRPMLNRETAIEILKFLETKGIGGVPVQGGGGGSFQASRSKSPHKTLLHGPQRRQNVKASAKNDARVSGILQHKVGLSKNIKSSISSVWTAEDFARITTQAAEKRGAAKKMIITKTKKHH